MKTYKILISCFFLTIFACGKQENLCHTYPQDTVAICGKTHSILAGKLWQLDSVVLNGENITPYVMDTLNANAYAFFISKNLVNGTSSLAHKIASALLIIGHINGDTAYSGVYAEDHSVHEVLPFVHDDARLGKFYNNSYICGIFRTHQKLWAIEKLSNEKILLSMNYSDTILLNYYSEH
jgi:hypothetical protein